MTEKAKSTKELEKTVDDGASITSDLPADKTVNRSSFSSWSRAIPPAELKKPDVARAIAKMLLMLNDDLQRDLEKAHPFEAKFYEADKRTEVLKERIRGLQKSVGVKVLFSSAGFGLVGFSPFLWDKYVPLFILAIALGIVLIVVGYFIKDISDKFEK